MKKILLACMITISCSGKYNYKYEKYTINGVYTGRASERAIENDSFTMKKSTCCDGVELSAKMVTLRSNSEFTLNGNRESNQFNILGNGKIIQIMESKCESRINNFEECYCLLDIANQHNDILEKEVASSDLKNGWISNNTFLFESKGSSTSRAKEKQSAAMKEATCIDSSQTNAIKSMIFDLQDEIQKDKKTINLKTKLPSIYLKSCESSNSYEDCNCKFAFHEEGVKDRLSTELNKQ
ncbi:MAG TPA: hypothetical protein PLX69_15590 [Leptospiraceae bacterium]|nr:hypothetical protein [Leptospiraceae bacterium]